MTVRPITFFHRGELVEVDDAAPTRSVLDWLREDARCTGTKEGCNEGDCGACTVVVGELEGDTLALKPVNSCIRFLPTLDGKALFTVEDVKTEAGLHPVQQALVECHGSQCGFCTPGFVMSMWSVYQRGDAPPSRQAWADELSGNLCRCTGYRPILDAAQRLHELPKAAFDAAPAVAALKSLATRDDLVYEHGGARFEAPRTLEALAARVESRPEARLLAGATDIGLWVTKQFRALPDLVYLGEVEALRRIETLPDGTLHIGAGAPLESAWRALVERVPPLHEVWKRFAGPPVRHAGTMGGNLANGSPIGDAAPVLMALDASLWLRRGARERRLPLSEFYVDYQQNRLEPGEFVQAIVVPPLPAAREVRAWKISKRYDCDISALCAGFALELDGETVKEVRLAYGGMAATVRRAAQAEAALTGQRWDDAAVQRAQAALARDFTPLSDLRASADYRLQVAQNLLMRLWLETRPAQPLPAERTTVWAALAAPGSLR